MHNFTIENEQKIFNKLPDMSAWSEEQAKNIGAQIKERRKFLGITAQELADRTEQLGHPISRSTITQIEIGKRGDRLLIGDLLVMAYCLSMPLALLLYPNIPDGNVEYLPHTPARTMEAIEALTGDRFLYTDEDETSDDSRKIREVLTSVRALHKAKSLEHLKEELQSYSELRDELLIAGNLEAIKEVDSQIEQLKTSLKLDEDHLNKMLKAFRNG